MPAITSENKLRLAYFLVAAFDNLAILEHKGIKNKGIHMQDVLTSPSVLQCLVFNLHLLDHPAVKRLHKPELLIVS